ALRNFPVFSGYSLNEKLLILQAFIGVNSIAMLLLSVLLYQQQKAQESLLELNRDLDLKVMERTEDLQKSLAEIQKLKIMQDGDYFLTSLLIQPFIVNLVQSEKAEAEFLISQKKKFEFHNKKYEIGGDMCHAQNLVLEGKKYILFINSDAMGKSLQGAGGAIVFGSVLFSIIGRTRDRNISPEKWLSDAFQELNDVFLSFDGSMLVSVILCLLDEDTGVLYYINAEHPSSVIYRDNICEFIDKENRLFKLGSCFNTLKKVSVQTVSLNRNDTVILGSDGRDDIDLQENAHKIRKNFDETLFLRTVEEAEGDLKKIFRLTEEKGMITDDYSLMKIKYKNEIHPRNDIRKSALEHYNRKNFKEATVYAEKYAELFPGDTDIFYILGYIFRTEKNLPKAEYYSERVRLRNPYFLPNLISLAKIYISQNRLSDAQKILMECKEIDPDHPSVVKLEAATQGEGIRPPPYRQP
ncbi:MAG TPA: SpoIIE family protein phosphatase, partial [Leptospiraceae bacterium]|nr:SpoIIE family protein phosphatase [Leptospiraceae bacterium]